MTLRSTTPYTYNGDGVLVADGTTRYTQDLAAPLSQVLQTPHGDIPTQYLYGADRLAALTGSRTFDDAGAPLGVVHYDPWGGVETGRVPMFGFTGELQPGGDVYLRARWYNAGQGTFTTRDPFAGMAERPASLMPYLYAWGDPVGKTDPSGRCLRMGDYCFPPPMGESGSRSSGRWAMLPQHPFPHRGRCPPPATHADPRQLPVSPISGEMAGTVSAGSSSKCPIMRPLARTLLEGFT